MAAPPSGILRGPWSPRWVALAAALVAAMAAPAAATWKLELAHDPDADPSAPWTDLRGVAVVPAVGAAPGGVVVSFNNVRGEPEASAVVLFERGGVFVAEQRYATDKAKAVAADSRGFVYVGRPGAVEVLVVEPDEEAESGFAFTTVQRIDLAALTGGAVGGVEGIGIREDGGDVTLLVSERGTDARLFAVDVSAVADEPAVLATGFGPGGDGVFALPSAAGLDASLRGVHVDPAGRVWVCANGRNRVFVIDAEGTTEVATILLPGALDVVTDEQYAYVTTFRGSLSGVFQIALASVGGASPPLVELADDVFFPAPDGSGGLTGIDIDRGPVAGQGELLIGIEEVEDALEPVLGGRDLVIRNGTPFPDGLAVGTVGLNVVVQWIFEDVDDEDSQVAYRIRVHDGLNGTGQVLFEALVTASEVDVIVAVDPNGPLPRSVSVSVFDAALEGNTIVVNLPESAVAALFDATHTVEGGGCSLGATPAGGPVRSPLMAAFCAAITLRIALRRRRRVAALAA